MASRLNEWLVIDPSSINFNSWFLLKNAGISEELDWVDRNTKGFSSQISLKKKALLIPNTLKIPTSSFKFWFLVFSIWKVEKKSCKDSSRQVDDIFAEIWVLGRNENLIFGRAHPLILSGGQQKIGDIERKSIQKLTSLNNGRLNEFNEVEIQSDSDTSGRTGGSAR